MRESKSIVCRFYQDMREKENSENLIVLLGWRVNYLVVCLSLCRLLYPVWRDILLWLNNGVTEYSAAKKNYYNNNSNNFTNNNNISSIINSYISNYNVNNNNICNNININNSIITTSYPEAHWQWGLSTADDVLLLSNFSFLLVSIKMARAIINNNNYVLSLSLDFIVGTVEWPFLFSFSEYQKIFKEETPNSHKGSRGSHHLSSST